MNGRSRLNTRSVERLSQMKPSTIVKKICSRDHTALPVSVTKAKIASEVDMEAIGAIEVDTVALPLGIAPPSILALVGIITMVAAETMGITVGLLIIIIV